FPSDVQLRGAVDGRRAIARTLAVRARGPGGRPVVSARARFRFRYIRRSAPLHAALPRRLHVLVQAFLAALTTEAALAIAAEAGSRVEHVRRVDPDGAGLELRCNVEREVDALRPDARGEAVARVVREVDRLGVRAERHEYHDRPEDLDLRDRRCGR